MKLREILESHKEFYNSREKEFVATSKLRKTYEGFLDGEAKIDENSFLYVTMLGQLKKTFFQVS